MLLPQTRRYYQWPSFNCNELARGCHYVIEGATLEGDVGQNGARSCKLAGLYVLLYVFIK